MDSRSLWPVLSGKARHNREFVRSALGKWRLVYDGEHKLIRGFDPSVKTHQQPSAVSKPKDILFDLQTDPVENINLASSRGDVVERLRKLLPT
jgi:YD repeat-containing protein